MVWSCVEERGWSCVEERGWSCVEERGWSCVEERGWSLDFKAEGKRKKRRWKRQVEVETMKVGSSREDVLWRGQWIVGANQIAARLR